MLTMGLFLAPFAFSAVAAALLAGLGVGIGLSLVSFVATALLLLFAVDRWSCRTGELPRESERAPRPWSAFVGWYSNRSEITELAQCRLGAECGPPAPRSWNGSWS
jgi:hypothetical protein